MAFGQPAPVSPDLLNPQPLAGMQPASLPPMAPIAAAVAKPKINWLGVLADALSGAAGQSPLYTQSLLRQKELDQQQSLAQIQSDRELTREKSLFDYENANRATQEGETERLIDMAATLPDSDPRKALVLRKLNGNDDPLVTLTLPGNRVYSGPRSGLGAALSGATAAGTGTDNVPTTEDGYSYTPGPGGRANQANWKPIGGQSGAGPTGGFR